MAESANTSFSHRICSSDDILNLTTTKMVTVLFTSIYGYTLTLNTHLGDRHAAVSEQITTWLITHEMIIRSH